MLVVDFHPQCEDETDSAVHHRQARQRREQVAERHGPEEAERGEAPVPVCPSADLTVLTDVSRRFPAAVEAQRDAREPPGDAFCGGRVQAAAVGPQGGEHVDFAAHGQQEEVAVGPATAQQDDVNGE